VIEGRAPICTAVFGRTRPTARRSLFGGSSGLLRSLGVTADRVRRPGIRTQISDTRARRFAGETSSVRHDLRLSSTASLSGWPYLRAYQSSLWYDSASAGSKLRHEPQLRSYPLQQVRVGTLPKSSCAQDVTLFARSSTILTGLKLRVWRVRVAVGYTTGVGLTTGPLADSGGNTAGA